MSFAGWVFISFSWGAIIILTAFCFIKVFYKKKLD